MATKTKNWTTGTGSVTIVYDGQGDGNIIITSDASSLYEARSMQIAIETTNGSSIKRVITVNQAAKQRINLSAAVVTAANQTYSGGAKTPAPTVTLNGTTIPSSGYDVAYSNNTNAGTATITVTGKGDYTGTASGTFTIAKASRTLSFTNRYGIVAPSSNITNAANPSAGSGDGTISYSSANTSVATVNSSGKVTAKTTENSTTITATISEGQNYLSASSSYTVWVFSTTHNFAYTGSKQTLLLPPGSYQLQCWGAQGANSSDGPTGGKGGYSIGQLTVSSETNVEVQVGGQNGYNGGGSSSGSSVYDSGDVYGRSTMGTGGGATDIRINNGGLLSRMIVAGGGAGAAFSYRREIITHTETETVSGTIPSEVNLNYFIDSDNCNFTSGYGSNYKMVIIDVSQYKGWNMSIYADGQLNGMFVNDYPDDGDVFTSGNWTQWFISGTGIRTTTVPDNATYFAVLSWIYNYSTELSGLTFSHEIETQEVEQDEQRVNGYVGGGTNGGGYSSSYYGKQNGAGSGGSFGQGASQSATNYRHCSAAGGGGWYGGGGGQYSDNDLDTARLSGGGSGFVNTAASAGNRPSGYTGFELDSGTLYAGNQSFPAPGGGNETGHSGNGYARITRLS